MPADEVLQTVLYTMYRWGHIACWRFDNGRPFGTPDRDSISPSALVLVGLGCEVIFNTPRSPTQNAKVERNQGTIARWADIRTCADIDEFRAKVEDAVIIQREKYPTRVCTKRTRLEAFPSLATNIRPYRSLNFCPQRIYRYIAKSTFCRIVGQHGQISLFGKRYQVGGKNRGKNVSATMIIVDGKPLWKVVDSEAQCIACIPATHIETGEYYRTVWPDAPK